MISSIDASSTSSAYQASTPAASTGVPTDTDFNDVLSQLQSAADALTNSVQAAENDLSAKLDQLYAKGQTALHDPRAIQWTDAQSAAAASTSTASVSSDQGTADQGTLAASALASDAPVSNTDAWGLDALSNLLQASRLYAKTDSGFLTKG